MAKSQKKTSSSSTSISSETSILDAFVALAGRKGAADVTLQEVAEQAGVAFGTVRYHFNDADRDLTQEALSHVIRKAYIFIDERLFAGRSKTQFNPLCAYVDAMFDWAKTCRADGSMLVYYYYMCTTKVSVKVPIAVILERARLRIESLIHESIGRALYPPINDPSGVALKIHLQVLGGCLIAGTLGTAEAYDAHRKLCIELVNQTMHASAVKR